MIWIYYYLLNGVGLDLYLDKSFWIRKIFNFWYLSTLTFGFLHHRSDIGKLNLNVFELFFWRIDYAEERGKILNVLLVYVRYIKSTVMRMDISSCTNYQKIAL